MIRELTKSALSFSWALSLLGVKQAVNLGRSGQNGGDLFAPVTQVAVSQLDESLKGFFRSGDTVQTRVVDLAFSWVNPMNWMNSNGLANMSDLANPSNWINPEKWMRTMSSMTQFGSRCCGGNGGNGGQTSSHSGGGDQGASGWGNMPGA